MFLDTGLGMDEFEYKPLYASGTKSNGYEWANSTFRFNTEYPSQNLMIDLKVPKNKEILRPTFQEFSQHIKGGVVGKFFFEVGYMISPQSKTYRLTTKIKVMQLGNMDSTMRSAYEENKLNNEIQVLDVKETTEFNFNFESMSQIPNSDAYNGRVDPSMIRLSNALITPYSVEENVDDYTRSQLRFTLNDEENPVRQELEKIDTYLESDEVRSKILENLKAAGADVDEIVYRPIVQHWQNGEKSGVVSRFKLPFDRAGTLKLTMIRKTNDDDVGEQVTVEDVNGIQEALEGGVSAQVELGLSCTHYMRNEESLYCMSAKVRKLTISPMTEEMASQVESGSDRQSGLLEIDIDDIDRETFGDRITFEKDEGFAEANASDKNAAQTLLVRIDGQPAMLNVGTQRTHRPKGADSIGINTVDKDHNPLPDNLSDRLSFRFVPDPLLKELAMSVQKKVNDDLDNIKKLLGLKKNKQVDVHQLLAEDIEPDPEDDEDEGFVGRLNIKLRPTFTPARKAELEKQGQWAPKSTTQLYLKGQTVGSKLPLEVNSVQEYNQYLGVLGTELHNCKVMINKLWYIPGNKTLGVQIQLFSAELDVQSLQLFMSDSEDENDGEVESVETA
jgi:hypothetical protein